MLSQFIDSWSLFQHAYTAGLMIAVSLAVLGPVLLGRNQIFLSLVATQAASGSVVLYGSLLALLGQSLHDSLSLSLSSIAGALLVSLPALNSRQKTLDQSQLGWLFAAISSGSLLLVAQNPDAAHRLQQLTASSLIGASANDCLLLLLYLLVLLVWFGKHWRAIYLLVLDPPMAMANGLPVRRLSWMLASLLGVGIGLAIPVAGSLYVFGLLLLPALLARQLCSRLSQMLWLSPVLALLSSGLSLMLANHYDSPPAQVNVALLAAGLLLAKLVNRQQA